MVAVEFYFDYLSPYSYLGWHRLVRKCSALTEFTWIAYPVVFAALLEHHGQLGPAEIPPKRVFIFSDVHRRAREMGLPFDLPRTHPFFPLPALRATLAAEAIGVSTTAVITVLFAAAWGGARVEMGDPVALANVLNAAGLPGDDLLDVAQAPAVKDALRANTEAALAKGVFGVPTFAVGDRLFWGQDRLDDAVRCSLGEDPVPEAWITGTLLTTQASVHRKITPLRHPPVG